MQWKEKSKQWPYATFNIISLMEHGWDQTTAKKIVTRGEHKGKWVLMWNPTQGGLWAKY